MQRHASDHRFRVKESKIDDSSKWRLNEAEKHREALGFTGFGEIEIGGPLEQVEKVVMLVESIRRVKRVLEHPAVQETLRAGIASPDKVFKIRCQYLKAVNEGRYNLASNFCLNLIEHELVKFDKHQYSALRAIFGHSREEKATNLTYSQAEKITSSCIESILEKSQILGIYYKQGKPLIYGANLPNIFRFLQAKLTIPGQNLSVLSLTSNNSQCTEILIRYDFIKTLKVRLFEDHEQLEKLTYKDLYWKIKDSIPYQFMFIQLTKGTPKDKVKNKNKEKDKDKVNDKGKVKDNEKDKDNDKDKDSEKAPWAFGLIPFQWKVYLEGAIKPGYKIPTKEIFIARMFPQIAEWHTYMDHVDSGLVRKLKLELNAQSSNSLQDAKKVKRTVYFIHSPTIKFKPLARWLETLFQQTLIVKPNFEQLDDLCNTIKNPFLTLNLDLAEFLSTKIDNLDCLLLKPDEEPKIATSDEDLLLSLTDLLSYPRISDLRPSVVCITTFDSRSIEYLPSSISLDSNTIVYSLVAEDCRPVTSATSDQDNDWRWHSMVNVRYYELNDD